MRIVLIYLMAAFAIWGIMYSFPEIRKAQIKHKRRFTIAAVFGLFVVVIVSILEGTTV